MTGPIKYSLNKLFMAQPSILSTNHSWLNLSIFLAPITIGGSNKVFLSQVIISLIKHSFDKSLLAYTTRVLVIKHITILTH